MKEMIINSFSFLYCVHDQALIDTMDRQNLKNDVDNLGKEKDYSKFLRY
jgi:hypothetical protein